jgi:hypothetical protein
MNILSGFTSTRYKKGTIIKVIAIGGKVKAQIISVNPTDISGEYLYKARVI